MTPYPNELKEQVRGMKVAAFNQITSSLNIDPKHMGHKSHGDMALHVIRTAHQEIERVLRVWEKAHPE